MAEEKFIHMIGVKELTIESIDDPSCWIWRSNFPGSRYEEVPELIGVENLDIRGEMAVLPLKKGARHDIYLVLKLVNPVGFDKDAKWYVYEYRDGEFSSGLESTVNLNEAQQREDGWMEMNIGSFYKMEDDDDERVGLLRLHLQQDEKDLKSGIIIEGIEIRSTW